MNLIEFNLLMITLAIFALAASLFVLSTIEPKTHSSVVLIRVFVSALLMWLHIDLLMRFFV